MSGLDVISWLLIVLAISDWIATVTLIRAARIVNEDALSERASTSVILSIGATGAAVLGGARLLHIEVPALPNLGLLVLGLVALSVPQLVWLVLLAAGRFR